MSHAVRMGPVSTLIATAAGLAAGCLPAGDPPLGRHLVSDRTISGLYFVPAGPTHPARLVVQGPTRIVSLGDPLSSASFSVADLFRVVEDNAKSTPAARVSDRAILILQNSGMLLGCSSFSCGTGPTIPADALGKILVPRATGDLSGYAELLRVDLATGEQVDLGPASFELSPGRTRIALSLSSETASELVIVELDDRRTMLGPVGGHFVGEDYYFVGSDRVLRRLLASGASEIVLPDVRSFSVTTTQSGPLLLVCHAMQALPTDYSCSSVSILDPATLREVTLPTGSSTSLALFSPDGRRVALAGNPRTPEDPAPLVVFDRLDETTEDVGLAADFPIGLPEWRPQHDELWLTPRLGSDSNDIKVAIWKPGQGLTLVPALAFSYPNPAAQQSYGVSIFTRDGRHWFTLAPEEESDWRRGHAYVRSADDPTAPGFALNSNGTGPGLYWELGDGRLLVEAFVTDYNRNDISIVDPDTGAVEPIASGGHIMGLGATRALALLKWMTSGNSGDLTLIDLRTGATTLLAENVFALSLERGAVAVNGDAAADPLAPGARVAFLVKNRFASPYDGLWIATLP